MEGTLSSGKGGSSIFRESEIALSKPRACFAIRTELVIDFITLLLLLQSFVHSFAREVAREYWVCECAAARNAIKAVT